MIPNLIQTSFDLITKNTDKYGDEVLEALSDIADSEPKFFKKDFLMLQQMLQKVVYNKDIHDNNLK